MALQVWSLDQQHQHHQGTCQKREPSVPILDLLNQKLRLGWGWGPRKDSSLFHKPSKRLGGPHKFENHCGQETLYVCLELNRFCSRMLFCTSLWTCIDTKSLKHQFEGTLTKIVVSETNFFLKRIGLQLFLKFPLMHFSMPKLQMLQVAWAASAVKMPPLNLISSNIWKSSQQQETSFRRKVCLYSLNRVENDSHRIVESSLPIEVEWQFVRLSPLCCLERRSGKIRAVNWRGNTVFCSWLFFLSLVDTGEIAVRSVTTG